MVVWWWFTMVEIEKDHLKHTKIEMDRRVGFDFPCFDVYFFATTNQLLKQHWIRLGGEYNFWNFGPTIFVSNSKLTYSQGYFHPKIPSQKLNSKFTPEQWF